MTSGNTGHDPMGVDGSWHRIHPLSLVIDITERVRSMIGTMISLLVIVAWTHPPRRIVWTLIASVVAATVLWRIAAWMRKRYRLGDDDVALRTGVFNTVVTTIPYDHIHTIKVSSPVFFRPFGLVGVTIDSGGTSDGSAIVLAAVPARLGETLERLREQAASTEVPGGDAVFGRHSPAVDAEHGTVGADHDGGRLVFRASFRDTVLFALTDLGFLAALAVIYGFSQNLRDLLPEGMVDRAEYAVFRFAAGSVPTAVMVVAAMVASMLVISVVKSLLQYHRFEVWRRGDDLIIVRGLLTRRSVTIPVSRVQTIIIRQSVLRRALHLSSVQVGLTTPGTGGDGDDTSTRGDILPVIADGRLYDTLRGMLPEWDPHEPAVRRTARGLGRYLLAMPVACTLASMLAVAVAVMATATVHGSTAGLPPSEATFPDGDPLFEPWFHVMWLMWLVLLPATAGAYACAGRWLRWRTEGYELRPGRQIIVTGARGLNLVTMVTHRSRIQYVRRRTFPWRIRTGVESMVMPLFVMNGYSWLRFTVIRSREARRLHDWATGPAS
ncbi:PH domain-containing protein [Bifidobacterium catulorum]|uniref:YdbS-like PH domain-containing protein n=1 Tax=Bifidobacterium catulorum TaxID=1630173 RepID=A0A2U2MSN6_9BIFI|nr:PH domain-containing protein [Bifidobacterium catulorum]PWG59853.1 hypothetical protein DF200_05365 [Bifidobacterium catulorum]